MCQSHIFYNYHNYFKAFPDDEESRIGTKQGWPALLERWLRLAGERSGQEDDENSLGAQLPGAAEAASGRVKAPPVAGSCVEVVLAVALAELTA